MNFLLEQGPANTTAYMIAGYTVIFSAMLLYLISLVVRQRNLEQDLEALESLQKENNP